MDPREVMREMGRKGGKARARRMTADERRASAIKASKAAAEARQRKKTNPNSNFACEIGITRKDGRGGGK